MLDKDAMQAIGSAPRASGTLESHYAPNAKVRLMDAKSMQTALDLLETLPLDIEWDGMRDRLGRAAAS